MSQKEPRALEDRNQVMTSSSQQNERKIIFRDGDLTVEKEMKFTSEMIDFLEETTWGTEETLYKHKRTDERVRCLKKPVLTTLRINGELRSMVVIEERKLRLGNRYIKGYFFRYLAHKLDFRERRRFGIYSRKLIRSLVEDETDEAIFYASVESKNHRSGNLLSKLGYEETAMVGTIAYNRFFPQRDKRFERINSESVDEVKTLLHEYQGKLALAHDNYIFQKGNYFVLRERGKIIAGCQVHPATWVIKNIPSRFSNFLLKFGRYIPFLNSLFNPDKFKFLTLEGFVVAQGREKELLNLFESVMHHFKVRVILIWLDIRDPLYSRLKKLGRHGLMNKFVDNAAVKIVLIPEKASEYSREFIDSKPLYISSFDFI